MEGYMYDKRYDSCVVDLIKHHRSVMLENEPYQQLAIPMTLNDSIWTVWIPVTWSMSLPMLIWHPTLGLHSNTVVHRLYRPQQLWWGRPPFLEGDMSINFILFMRPSSEWLWWIISDNSFSFDVFWRRKSVRVANRCLVAHRPWARERRWRWGKPRPPACGRASEEGKMWSLTVGAAVSLCSSSWAHRFAMP